MLTELLYIKNIIVHFKPGHLHALKLFLFFCGGMLFCLQSTFGQTTDSLTLDSAKTKTLFDYHTARVEYFVGDDIDNFNPLDTTLNLFQRFNPARDGIFEYAYLGNFGAPAYNRFFEFNRTVGFDYGRHERDIYLTDIDEVKYYRCNVPFTNLYYVAGSQGEQLFHVTHTRNVGKDFNVAIDFNKIVSDGYFPNMHNDYSDVNLSAWYKTKNEKYQIYFAGIHGNVTADENGGVQNDSVFDLQDPASVLAYRDDAQTDWKNWQGQIQQQLLFGKKLSYAIDDTTTGYYFVPKFKIAHTIGIHDYYYQFEDAAIDRTYYGDFYDDGQDTLRDRAEVFGFYNKVAIGNLNNKVVTKDSTVRNNYNWELYGLQEWHELSDGKGKYDYTNLITGINANARFLFDSLITIKVAAAYDWDNAAMQGSGRLRFPKIPFNPELLIEYRDVNATVIQEHYYGFDNRWDLLLENTSYLRYGLRLKNEKFKLELIASRVQLNNYYEYGKVFGVNNMIYPVDENITQVLLVKNFLLGNFHLNNAVGLQLMDGNLHYPEYLGNISWYYQNHLFKSALFFQAGFDAWYNSEYKEYGYDITNGMWVNGNIKATPKQYPVIDVFLNFDVETLRFFVKMDNIAQGLFSNGYYQAPNYPMQPRAFRLGLNWFLFY